MTVCKENLTETVLDLCHKSSSQESELCLGATSISQKTAQRKESEYRRIQCSVYNRWMWTKPSSTRSAAVRWPPSSYAKLVLTLYIRMMDQDFLNNVMTDSDVTTKSRRSRMSETKKHRFIFLLVRHCSTFVNRKTQLFSWITYRSSLRCLWVLTRLWSRLSEHNVLVFGRNSLLDEVQHYGAEEWLIELDVLVA